mgnify:CR=1 FL=1
MRLFCLYINLLLYLPLFGQPLSFQHLTVQDGLAQSDIKALLCDSRGFVWAGTQGGGLSRYDGASFMNFSTRQGLPDNRVNALWEDGKGRLWIGTEKGLAFYEGTDVKVWGERKLNVKALHQDTSGQLWIGTASGLYRLTEQSVTRLPRPSRQINTIFTDKSGHTWLGTREGLWELVDGAARQMEGFSMEVLAIGEDQEGLLYLATEEEGLVIWNGFNFTPFIGNRWIPNQQVRSIFHDDSGDLWLGSTKGLSLWDATGVSMQRVALDKGQAVHAIDKDIWGNIWLGTSRGLSLHGGRLFEFYPSSTSNGQQAVSYLGALPNRKVGYAVGSRGLYELADSSLLGNQWKGISDITIRDIAWDSDSTAWVASWQNGLLRWEGDSLQNFGRESGLDVRGFKELQLDSAGTVWALGNDGGLWQIQFQQDTTVSIEAIRWGRREGISSIRLSTLHLDEQERFWIGTEDAGLLCWRKGALLYQFDRRLGMPGGELTSVVEDTSGFLWVGSKREGLARLDIYADSIGIERFTYEDGLFSSTVNSILCTRGQDLWLGSQGGVDHIQLDADRMLKSVQHYGPAEGFQGVETLPKLVQEDPDGNLYWGTVAGIVKYNANLVSNTTVPPGIVMTGIKLFTEDLQTTTFGAAIGTWNSWDTRLSFPYNQNNFTFSYLGIAQNQASKIRYQYQLVGWDPEWSSQTDNKEIAYANLTPGNYTFQVRSIQMDTGITSDPIELAFEIKAPWWEWRAVRWGGILLLILLLLGVFWRTLRRVRIKAREAEERLRLDKQILELEQKALQLQMNPHFIFNALNSIQLLIGKQDPKTARRYLAKFSKLMRSTLENARQPKILLEEEVESLETYLAIEQFSRGDSFDYEIQVVPEEEAAEVSIPSMMIQPFVENAILHGVGPMKARGYISVHFEIQEQEVICEVKDNGVGLSGEGSNSSGHKSLALQVTRERLALLEEKGRSFDEVFEIGSNPGEEAGTYVKIHLPLL